jgi:hypothetical protein
MQAGIMNMHENRDLSGQKIDTVPLPTYPSWLTPALVVIITLIYVIFPTRNYYWDGVSFAISIEDAHSLPSLLIHPKHLLYNVIGYSFWICLKAIRVNLRVLISLQVLSIIVSAACIWLLHRLLLHITKSVYLGTALCLLFAFSATWWKFSTDANAYIISTLTLIIAAYLICICKRTRPVLIGFVHSCGMLVHQLAIFFIIPAAFQIYRKSGIRCMLQYVAASGGITAAAYYLAFLFIRNPADENEFISWITRHSPDSAFSFSLWSNFITTVKSLARLFLGGRILLFKQFLGPFLIITFACLIIVSVLLIYRLGKGWRDWRLFNRSFRSGNLIIFALLWIVVYGVFLFFWLPRNTFYKLFYLPGIILLAAELLVRYGGPRRYRLALFSAAIALANLTFFIFPYSHIDANQPLRFAIDMQSQWSEKTVVYYKAFNTDDWLIQYFNPSTKWKEISSEGPDGFKRDAMEYVKQGYEVWIDTTAADALAGDISTKTLNFTTIRELANYSHRIKLMRWNPQPE